MKLCRLCEKSGDFADAHVIPKAFFSILRDGDRPPLVVTDREGVPPKRSPIGEYDQGILCKICEPLFSAWDSYGKTVLADAIKGAVPVREGADIIGYRLSNIDIPRLRMFFIAVLWRASVSTRDFFRNVTLGPFEDRARACILNRSPGGLNDFSVIIAKWDGDWLAVNSNPYMIKMDGINVVVFEMLDYKVYIKVDKRPVPDGMKDFVLGENGGEISVPVRNFGDSKERQVLQSLAPRFLK